MIDFRKKRLQVASFVLLAFAGSALSSPVDMSVPETFKPFEAKALDQAWVNPEFDASNYKKIAIKWSEFDYRPGKTRFEKSDRTENYELPPQTKEHLEERAKTAFNRELERLKGHQLVELADADAETLIVHLSISDFVNNVPSRAQIVGQTQFITRQFGEATLTVELSDHQSLSPLFKGQVRTSIQPVSFFPEVANVVTANRRTSLQFERWARDLRKNITKLSLL